RSVDLLAEVADVHVDHVGVALEAEVPHVLEDSRARKELAGMAHEVLEECELLRREVNSRRCAGDPVQSRIELEGPDAEDRRAFARPPSDQRAQTGQQLAEGEWLDEVVVGSTSSPVTRSLMASRAVSITMGAQR